MLIKPKNLRETSAPHRWRPNIGPGPGEPKTRTAREKSGWEKRENEGEKKKKDTNEKEQQPFYPLACPLSSLLFPLHPSISQGRCSLGPERMKVKKGDWREKKMENCLSNITPVLRTGSVLSGEGKGRLRRRENKVGECIREAHAPSLSLMRSQNDMSIHTHPGLHQHTHTHTHQYHHF